MLELTALMFYLQIRRLPHNQYTNKMLAQWFLGTSLLACLVTLFSAPISLNAAQGRWQGLFFHPNFLGIFTVCMLAIAPELKTRWKIVGLAMILMSGSRLAIVLLFALLLIRRQWINTLIILILGVIWLSWKTHNYPVEKWRLTGSTSFEMRAAIYSGSLKTILMNPFGTGPGIFGPKAHETMPQKFHELFPDPKKHSVYKAHNSILEWSVESGWLIPLLFVAGSLGLLLISPSNSNIALMLLLLGSMLSVIANYPAGLIILTYLTAISIPKQASLTIRSVPSQPPLIATRMLAVLIRLIIPLLIGIFMILYGYLNLQAHRRLPQIINDLNQGEIHNAWIKLNKQLDNPCLQLQSLYYYFRIASLADNHQDILAFFEKTFPAWVDISYQLSLIELQKDNLEAALNYIEKSIDYHPLWKDNYILKSSILHKMNRITEALEADRRASDLNQYKEHFRN